MNSEDITASFYEKELQSTNQQKYRTEKIKEWAINYMSNGKDTMTHSIVGLIKKISYKNE